MRRLSPHDQWTAAVAALVVVLGGGAAWVASHRHRPVAVEPPPERVMRQIREQLGRSGELRYAEAGQKRSMCGYVGRSADGPAVGFVSIPNRILFSDDPLPQEFRELRRRYCPGVLAGPASPTPTP